MSFSRYPWCVCLALAAVCGQSRLSSSLRGEVQGGGLPSVTEIELTPCAGGRLMPAAASVHPTGTFELRDVEPGCYRVRVFSPMNGREYYRSIHEVGGPEALRIRLAETKPERPISGVVSWKDLRGAAPEKALRAFRKASALSARGDAAAAVEKLREAIRRHEFFAEAHINLGAQYARMGRHADALRSFDKARQLGVSNAALEVNAAVALLESGRLTEAEEATRLALRLDENYLPAHFIQGQLHLRLGRALDRAEVSLRRASEGVSGARILLAQVLARRGEMAGARRELELYLNSGHVAYRKTALRLMEQCAPTEPSAGRPRPIEMGRGGKLLR